MNIRRDIIKFIIEQKTRWNALPGRSVLCKHFGGVSEDVNLHLEQLEREGLLVIEQNGGERVDIPPTFQPVPQLELRSNHTEDPKPFCGIGASGRLALDLRGLGIPMEPNMFALRMADESMLDAGLQRGDIAILKHASPLRGDIVAVELEGQMVLRRYVVIAGIPHVLAENPLRPDLQPHWELPLHGVLWGSLRTEPNRYLPDHVRRNRVSYSNPRFATQSLNCRNRVPADVVSANKHTRDKEFRQPKPLAKRRAKAVAKTNPAGHYSRSEVDWPHPPSGIELNDMTSLEYRSIEPSFIDDEPRYGEYLRQALQDYEEKEKKRAKQR